MLSSQRVFSDITPYYPVSIRGIVCQSEERVTAWIWELNGPTRISKQDDYCYEDINLNNCLFFPHFVKKKKRVGLFRGITLDLSKILLKK